MKNRTKHIILVLIWLIVITINFNIVLAPWYPGSLHQHTGFSTETGYDGIENVGGDDCDESLEGVPFIETENGQTAIALSRNAISEELSWLGFSDHSYCMNFAEFQQVESDCNLVDSDPDFTCLMGEELSTQDAPGDSDSETILRLSGTCNNPTMGEAHIGGYGISARIPQTPEEMHCPDSPTAQDGINAINTGDGVSILNHPHPQEGGFLDFESVDEMNSYTGIEIFNGNWDTDDEDSLNTWINILLRGDKVYAYGGTDEHEDVSRVNDNYVYLTGSLNQANLKDALKNGRVTVSNYFDQTSTGGYAYIEARSERQTAWTMQGGTVSVCLGDDVDYRIIYDVDNSCNLAVYQGDLSEQVENPINLGSISGSSSVQRTDFFAETDAYYRAECLSGDRRIYTNPVWVDVDTSDSDSDGVCNTNDCSASNEFIFPGSTNLYCNCDSTDGFLPTTEIAGDATDNDCDGQIDEGSSCTNGETRACPLSNNGVCIGRVQTCSVGSWSTCSYGASYQVNEVSCGDNQDNDCDGLVDSDDQDDCNQCGGANEGGAQCEVHPNRMLELYPDGSTFPQWERIRDSEVALISGSDPEQAYAARFDIDRQGGSRPCNTNIENNIVDVFDVKMRFRMYGLSSADNCTDTNLEVYTRSENDFSTPSSDIDDLLDSSNWDFVDNLETPICSPGLNEYEITSQFKDDISNYNDDDIGYGWWPSSSQDEWAIRTAGDNTYLRIQYCVACVDNDGDNYHNAVDGCGVTDCNDNNVRVFPYNSNPDCDCSGSPGATEICGDDRDNDCDGSVDESCDDDYDTYFDTSMGGTDCNDADATINPGRTEVCSDSIDNDCDGATDSADSQCGITLNGVSCASNGECQSGTCDADGSGVADDNWCFSAFNTYFDGQEPDRCEYATGQGVADCDERQAGTDINRCIGTSYYEEECSSTCGYQDITSRFECNENGCSCSESLCDGLSAGSTLLSCSSGSTLFADQCTATASRQADGSTICRSSDYANDCTAHTLCNGVQVGTEGCDENCNFLFNAVNSCGIITQDSALTQNISVNGTCFTIGASNIVIDGRSFTVLGNSTGIGVNNNMGYDNVIIRNLRLINFSQGIVLTGATGNIVQNNMIITSNATTEQNGINLYATNDSTIEENNITTYANISRGIFLTISHSNEIILNRVTTTGEDNSDSILLTGSHSNNLQRNTLGTSGWLSVGTRLSHSRNNTVSDNGIITRGSEAFALYIDTGANFNVLFSNNISTSGPNGYGIFIEVNSQNSNLSNNTIQTTGTLGRGIAINTEANNTIIEFNNITTTGLASEGILFTVAASENVTINSNKIHTTTNLSHGIYLTNVNNSIILDNVINADYSDANGLVLEGISNRNIVLNNNITAGNYEIRDLTSPSYSNYLIYNNSHGEIRWTDPTFLADITVGAISGGGIGLGRNLFIGNNIASLNTSTYSPLTINSSANITLRNLPFSTIDDIYKDHAYKTSSASVSGPDCLAAGCSVQDYSNSVLIFSTANFSSFTSYKNRVITHLGNISGVGTPNYLNYPRGIHISNNIAYVASSNDNALTTFNVSNASTLIHLGNISGSGAPNYLRQANDVFVSGNTAFVISNLDNALSTFDVSEPVNPIHLDTIRGFGTPNYLFSPRRVFVSGNVAYVVAAGSDALTTFDVSDPNNIVHLGVIRGAGAPNYLNNPTSVYVSGNIAYITSYDDDAFSTFNVTDPRNIGHLGTISGAGAPNYLLDPQSVFILDGVAYVVTRDSAFSTFDVSDPASIIRLDTETGFGAPLYLGNPYAVYVEGTTAYIVSSTALTIFDVSDPFNIIHLDAITGAGAPNFLNLALDIFVSENIIYTVAGNDDTLSTFRYD